MLEQYAYVAQIVGVLVVGATLIYLAIQTKQNTDAVQASSRHTAVSNDLLLIQFEMDHASAIESLITNNDDISFAEKIQAEAWLIGLARTRENQWLQNRHDLLDAKTMESFLTGLTLNISFPRSRAWWDKVAYDYFDSDFVDDVNRRLATIPIQESFVHPFDRKS